MSEAAVVSTFEDDVAAGRAVLTLAGMSNIGKSHWSKRLRSEAGFGTVSCDDLIEDDLREVLAAQGYEGGIEDVARWMGQPYDAQFLETQATYLDLETKHMHRLLDRVEGGDVDGNLVIDTTGSVVHTSSEICERLGALTTVVALAATPALRDEMYRKYLEKPKPVVWGNAYRPECGEPPETTLARCYPELLAARSGLYAAMAHVVIPYEVKMGFRGAADFLGYVQAALADEQLVSDAAN